MNLIDMEEIINNFIKSDKIEMHETGLYLIGKGDLKRLLDSYKKQLTLTDVVKSFYCYENLANGKEKCSNECTDCVGIKPMQ